MIKVISASVTIRIMQVKIMTIKIMQVKIMTIKIMRVKIMTIKIMQVKIMTIKIMRVKIMTIKIMQVNIMTIRIISRQRSAPGSVPPPDPPTLKVPLIRSDQNNTIQIRSDENYKIQIPMKNICCFFHLWRQIILTSH